LANINEMKELKIKLVLPIILTLVLSGNYTYGQEDKDCNDVLTEINDTRRILFPGGWQAMDSLIRVGVGLEYLAQSDEFSSIDITVKVDCDGITTYSIIRPKDEHYYLKVKTALEGLPNCKPQINSLIIREIDGRISADQSNRKYVYVNSKVIYTFTP